MSDDRLILTRQDLYELAWSKPLTELAKDFGISDVALAKRCRKLRVPVPGRGYWARVDAGQAPRRPALPEYETLWRERQMLTVQAPPKTPPSSSLEETTEEPGGVAGHTDLDSPSVIPSTDLLTATAAVRRTAVACKHSRRKELPFGRGEKSGPILELHVSSGVLDRALLFADTLLRTAESLGWTLVGPSESGVDSGADSHSRSCDPQSITSQTATPALGQLLVAGERITFHIEERVQEEPRNPTAAELAREKREYRYRAPRVSLSPTGALRLVRTDSSAWSARRKTWYDHRGRTIEGQIPQILQAFYDLALEIKARRAEAERRRRQQEEEARLQRELEERQEANANLIEILETQAGSWHRARLLRAYVRAAQRAVPSGLTAPLLGKRIDFLKWAEDYVNAMDPLHPQPRNPDLLPRDRSWLRSSEREDELARLSGHEWSRSWKRSEGPDERKLEHDDD